MINNIIGYNVLWLNEVGSTNAYAASFLRDPKLHGTVVCALYQTDGKGQRGNVWDSERGQNLLLSIVLHPTLIKVHNQFILSKAIAIALCKSLATLVNNVSIKWPNDIYINNRKVGGVLIENSFSSEYLESSIIGVGINVNQLFFSDDLPNPTSIKLETGKSVDVKDLLQAICNNFNPLYNSFVAGDLSAITNTYYNLLYRKDDYYTYKANGNIFVAKIFGVRNSGELVLQTESGELKEFAFKEVSFVLD